MPKGVERVTKIHAHPLADSDHVLKCVVARLHWERDPDLVDYQASEKGLQLIKFPQCLHQASNSGRPRRIVDEAKDVVLGCGAMQITIGGARP
jgi:hypothetical protein